MSDWMKVLPRRGVKAAAARYSIPGMRYTLQTPQGYVGVDKEDGEWEVYHDGQCVARLDTTGHALWLVIALYGEGAVKWDELHKQLFGGE